MGTNEDDRAEIHAIWMNGLTFIVLCVCFMICFVTCVSHTPARREPAKTSGKCETP
jgi:hypothetical protein